MSNATKEQLRLAPSTVHICVLDYGTCQHTGDHLSQDIFQLYMEQDQPELLMLSGHHTGNLSTTRWSWNTSSRIGVQEDQPMGTVFTAGLQDTLETAAQWYNAGNCCAQQMKKPCRFFQEE